MYLPVLRIEFDQISKSIHRDVLIPLALDEVKLRFAWYLFRIVFAHGKSPFADFVENNPTILGIIPQAKLGMICRIFFFFLKYIILQLHTIRYPQYGRFIIWTT